MALRESLLVVWRRRWLVLLAALVAGGSALAYSARQPKIYVAQAKLFIGPGNSSAADPTSAIEQVTLSQDFLTSYAQVLQTTTLAAQAVAATHLPISPDTLAADTKATVVPTTRIIDVTVSDTNAARAQLAANALVNTFVKSSLTQFDNQAGVLASVLEPAVLPSGPSSPKPLRNAFLGAFLGLVLGVGIVFLLDQLDPRLRSREEVDRIMAPLPILAAIPGVKNSTRELLFDKESNSPAAEAFRILRTNAQFFSLDEEPFSRVLVASPQGEDGKTTVAVNLAVSLAASGARTILLEADLRRPTASTYFGTTKSPGLSDALVGNSTLEEAMHETGLPNLTVVPAGTVPVNPSELLGSVRMVDMLDELSDGIDVLVIDTPPALVVTDATLLALHVDGVIIVLRAGRTHREGATKTKELFEQTGARLLGVVVNFASPEGGYGYPYHYHYYSPRPSGKNGKAPSATNGRSPSVLMGNGQAKHSVRQGGRIASPPFENAMGSGPVRATAGLPSRPSLADVAESIVEAPNGNGSAGEGEPGARTPVGLDLLSTFHEGVRRLEHEVSERPGNPVRRPALNERDLAEPAQAPPPE
jgi:succinoglycan biosynthesis transport protein ExoP